MLMNWPKRVPKLHKHIRETSYQSIKLNLTHILLYMFQASSAHLQEDTVVYMQHMVLSLSMRVRGGLSVHSLSEN